ncbi:MAG: hypothetical protein HYT71_01450 [Candidatus Aenigmarchaeota archaeon]|nr:hypothetical protein [Candidatus Aenigmarchaeota archaeon]
MRGSIYTFMGSIVMVMIGVGIIWWFRSVVPSEAFIVSERHRESFSALNYLELSRKSMEEAIMIYAQTGATKAGSAGGLDATAQQKDKIAIWKNAPDATTIKDTLQRYIVDEIAILQQHEIKGKFLAIDYGSLNIQINPDSDDFSKSEKFYVKGEKEIKVSKNLQTQAIKISTSLKGYIDDEIKLKYFALYDAAKKFFEGGEPVNRINSAFNGVNTVGSKTNSACPSASVGCVSKACPVFTTTFPTPPEVLNEKTDFSKLLVKAGGITGAIAGAPFSLFNAKFENYASAFLAGYGSSDITQPTGSCGFSCTYLEPNPCKTTVPDCAPAADSDSPPVCTPKCVPGFDTITLSCSAETKTTTIAFTFLADAYEKYSSEDPSGIVPSTSIHDVAVVSKPLPYDTLKFNFMTHSCTTIDKNAVVTELKDNIESCQLPPSVTNHV